MKKIIHMDLDAFFASVEQLDNPELRGKPVIVGGRENRGVVATCSYEARAFGIHSAMPGAVARRKCPEGIFLPVRYDRYKEKSAEVRQIYTLYSESYETLGLDEVYLDVSHYDDAIPIAHELQARIRDETGLTCSIGLSYNKSLAKIASDLQKPNGFVVIRQEQALTVLRDLPVTSLHGIGKKSAERLSQKEIYTIRDFWKLSLEEVVNLFGKFGHDLYHRARGQDQRAIVTDRSIKSLSRETTLPVDLYDREEIAPIARELLTEARQQVHNKKLSPQTLTLKIKFADFSQHTKQRTASPDANWDLLLEKLLDAYSFQSGVRLIGVGFSNFLPFPDQPKYEQLTISWPKEK